ncbi:MAG: 50S ribosomal protein L21 [Candidatus Daviesbacteria bacterium]|nr:50S ribosomal protein L21 [Candidatus Daviesbacteria bacterium]
MDYAICEISGKQYKVMPNKPFEVDLQIGEPKQIEVNVLMLSDSGKIELGKPYLSKKLTLNVLEDVKGEKIRVAKFHAKANYRRVTGHRAKMTRVVLSVKS